jgi:cell division protein ZapB
MGSRSLAMLVTDMTQTQYALELKNLEDKLDQLIDQYIAVKNENNSLKSRQEALIKEKDSLLEKTNLAKLRVEAMINRLKAMEYGS